MTRHLRAILGTLGVAVLALTPIATSAEKPTKADEHAQHFWDCAAVCDDCARTCNACATHCAKMVAEGKKDHQETLRTCQDCATMCTAASAITARTGPYSDLVCKACADACKKCGESCAKFKDNPMMARCAAVCVKCEKACRDMLKHVSADQ